MIRKLSYYPFLRIFVVYYYNFLCVESPSLKRPPSTRLGPDWVWVDPLITHPNQARPENLAWSHSVSIQYSLCIKRRFMKPWLLSSIANTECLFSQSSIPFTPTLNFISKSDHDNCTIFLYNLCCKYCYLGNHVCVTKIKRSSPPPPFPPPFLLKKYLIYL